MAPRDRTSSLLALTLVLAACTEDPAQDSGTAETTSSATDSEDGDTGTDTGGQACEGPWDQGFAVPMPELPAGDPQLGYEALLTEDYVSCGIPWELWAFAQDALADVGGTEPLPGREGKNAEVPYSYNVVTLPDGSEQVVANCLQCHAGKFNGELIIGLGNSTLDFTTPAAEFGEGLPALPETSDANIAFNKFVDHTSSFGPMVTMATVGANPAVMYAIVLLSHRDPATQAWSDEPLYELLEGKVLPADPPPWWRTAKKATQFSNGMSRGDHRGTMVLASSICADTNEDVEAVLDYFVDVQAYLASLEAPDYPFEIDAGLAGEGEEIFECNCSGCHGTYAEDPADETFPNMLIPTEVIGTDPTFAEYAADPEGYRYLEDWFNSSIYGTVTEIVASDPFSGYTAPPLDGIWATAPFLHNGSVPSLALVLDSTARPTYWRRVDYDSTNFDEDAVGWPWQELDYGQDQAADDERKYIYDTTLFGYGNGGHTFGDHLSPDERTAVLEYLKTL